MRPYADVALRAASRPSSCGSHDGNPHNSHSLICGILILDCRRPPVPASAFIHGALLRGRLAAVGDGTFPMCTLGCGAALNRPHGLRPGGPWAASQTIRLADILCGAGTPSRRGEGRSSEALRADKAKSAGVHNASSLPDPHDQCDARRSKGGAAIWSVLRPLLSGANASALQEPGIEALGWATSPLRARRQTAPGGNLRARQPS
jgi:hypothetical protein